MFEHILTIIVVFFGALCSLALTLPMLICMLDAQHHYLPFGIGATLGVIGAFALAYALRFHT